MTDSLYTHATLPRLAEVYIIIKDVVVARGFAWEMDWQADRRLDRVQESGFLRETAWTILSAGFRESIVRKVFDPISDAFLNWQSADAIRANRVGCRRAALDAFNNHRKIEAILEVAQVVADSGFDVIRHRIQEGGVRYLKSLPYVGPTTAFHLAKNLGLPVVKPDRHLQRIGKAAGFDSPQEMCEQISQCVGEPVQVVDVVLWRYATLFSDYVALFTEVSQSCDSGKSK